MYVCMYSCIYSLLRDEVSKRRTCRLYVCSHSTQMVLTKADLVTPSELTRLVRKIKLRLILRLRWIDR